MTIGLVQPLWTVLKAFLPEKTDFYLSQSLEKEKSKKSQQRYYVGCKTWTIDYLVLYRKKSANL